MEGQSFSERHGLRPPPEPKPFDYSPGAIRDGLEAIIHEISGQRESSAVWTEVENLVWSITKPLVEEVRKTTPPNNPMGGPFYHFGKVMQECEWWRVYDVYEEMFLGLQKLPKGIEKAKSLEAGFNTLLQKYGLTWTSISGRIEQKSPVPIATLIKEVRILLEEPKFKGPDEQFQKAVNFYNARPTPDLENCVKEAVGALEGVARIISGDKNATLGEIINKHLKGKVSPALIKVFEGLWGYSSNAPGARHGKVGSHSVSKQETELTLNSCAAGTLFLARLEL